VFESQQRVGLSDIVTGDESCFLQHYAHWQIWCILADEVPTRVTNTITAPQTMLTVFLSIDGGILINRLTPREKLNSGHFCKNIFEPCSEILHGGRDAGTPRLIVHLDNATFHRSAATEIAFNFANSDMLPSHHTARMSIRMTSFYPAI
jgi:hypothetical protein